MRPEFGSVQADWSDRTAYIIGGGASLKGFDFDVLRDEFTIGPNAAALRLNTDVFITVDRNFYKNQTDEIETYVRGGGEAYVSLDSGHKYHRLIDGVTYLQHQRGTGMSPRPEIMYGLHSGYAAVNLAFVAGCKDIRLLGFDMHYKTGESHWHGGYDWHREKNDRLVRRWAVAFDEAIEDFRAAGVYVTNYVGPIGSMITCLPTEPLESLLEDLAA